MKRFVAMILVLMVILTASGTAEKKYQSRTEMSDGSIFYYEYDTEYDAWAECSFDTDGEYDYLEAHVKSVKNNAVLDLYVTYEHDTYELYQYYVGVEEYWTTDNRMSWWCSGENCVESMIEENDEYENWVINHGMEDYELYIDDVIG